MQIFCPWVYTNVYTHVQKYGSNHTIVMLAAKKSAGVASDMGLRNPLHIGDDALKPRSDVTVGVSVAPQKGLLSSIFKKKSTHGKIVSSSSRHNQRTRPVYRTGQAFLSNFCVKVQRQYLHRSENIKIKSREKTRQNERLC